MTTVIPPFTPGDGAFSGMPNITPFTYRDGQTYLQRLERLKKYLERVLIPWVQENYDELAEAFTTQVNALITQVNAALEMQTEYVDSEIADLTTYVNEQVALIIGNSIVVQDDVVAALVADEDSDTRTATDLIYADQPFNRKNNLTGWFHVDGYGAIGDGVTDDTAAIAAAGAALQAAGGGVLYFTPGKTYNVNTLAEGAWLVKFTGITDITINAGESEILNLVSYTSDNITAIFVFDNCKNVTVKLGYYRGFTLPTPGTHLGYRGATVVQCVNACDTVKVDARILNARYGVLTGAYNDATKGNNSNFDITITGYMVGYAIAAYYANNITFNLDLDGVHRAAYLAGVVSAKGIARWRDMYIAPIAILITDALIQGTDAAAEADPVGAATKSRGSSDIDITSIDKGSTVFINNGFCAGIAMSRVDPCNFRNIKVNVHVVGTDTISTRTGGFLVTSSGIPHARYTDTWRPEIVLENIEVSGVVDHSQQTLPSNTTGEYYVSTQGTTLSATVRNVGIRGLVIRKSSSGTQRDIYYIAPNLSSPATFDSLYAPETGFQITANINYPVVLNQSVLGTLHNVGALIDIGQGSSVNAASSATPSRISLESLGVGGAGGVVMQKEITLALSGASTNWNSALLAGMVVLGVQGRIKSAITGATGLQVGVSGDLTRYADANIVANGATFTVGGTAENPRTYQAATTIIVTAKGGTFTTGSIRLIVTYIQFAAPTN